MNHPERLTVLATMLAVASVGAVGCTAPDTGAGTTPAKSTPAQTKTTKKATATNSTAPVASAPQVPRTRTLTLNTLANASDTIVILETGTQTPDKDTFITNASFIRGGKIYQSTGAIGDTLGGFSKMSLETALQTITQEQRDSLQSRLNDPDPDVVQQAKWGLANDGVFQPYVVKMASGGSGNKPPTESLCYAVPTFMTDDHKPFRCLDFVQGSPITTLQIDSATYFGVGQPTTSVLNDTPELAAVQLPADALFGWDKPGDSGILVDPSDGDITTALQGK